MGDVFKEQIVKKQASAQDVAKKAGILACGVLIMIVTVVASEFVPFLGSLLFLVLAAVVFGIFFLFARFKVEYEYVFTNGELDIDIIYNKARRKRVYAGRVAYFELMAHVEDKTHMGGFANAKVTKDYSSGVVKENTYAALVTVKGERVKMLLEPKESMLKAFSSVLTPRKLHKKI